MLSHKWNRKIIKLISIICDLSLTIFSFFGSYYIFLYIYNIIKNDGFNATIHVPKDNQILDWIYYFLVSNLAMNNFKFSNAKNLIPALAETWDIIAGKPK